ncbi:MAG: DEAD/DEAH box helicase [Anaerolineae bacterium]|nr:DEAD/DEAH box helicase [Anaerolineae bacterium]
MSDELTDYLVSELGFERKPAQRAGLDRAIDVFLGLHLAQRTPIQEQAIEIIYDGADVLIVSATASGKTEAAIVPIAARLLSQPGQILLYIAPTRALLNDLHRRLESPLHQLGLEARIRHGDYALPSNTSSIRVLFTTPESLDVLLSKNTPLLAQVRYIIIDEIHQLFGTPRGDQLVFLLQRLEYLVGERVQRVALSATVGSPDDIAQWLCPAREQAKVISVSGGRRIIGKFHWLSDLSLLRELLRTGSSNKVLYFVNSRRRCDDVYLTLQDLPPYDSFVHYSTLTKEQREYVERGFRNAQMGACVATTTLELGIDIGSIQEVVLVDAPTTVNSFLQRIGRGGRRGRDTHVTLTPQNPLQLLQFVAMLQLAENGQVETGIAGFPYSVFVQQIFSILAGKRRLNIHPDELVEQFGVFSWLNPTEINTVLERLVDKGYLRREPTRRIYNIGDKLEELIDGRAIFTNISGQSSGIPTFHSGRLLAHLPLQPDQAKHGNVILFAGRFWKITSISDRGLVVELVQPVPQPIRPAWNSKGTFSTSSILAQEMRHILVNQSGFTGHQFDQTCERQLLALYNRANNCPNTSEAIWYERVKDKYVYYTFIGAIENQILQLIFADAGFSCQPVSRAEGVALISRSNLDFNCLPTDVNRVIELVARHWRRFTGWVDRGPFFEDLPPTLKRDETVAKIAVAPTIETIIKLRGAITIPVNLQLVQ